MSNDKIPMRKVELQLNDPVTVVLAPPEVRGWGPYQFPLLVRLPDGRIQLSYHVEADSTTAYGLPPACAVSPDDGRTWELLPRETSGKGSTGSWYAPCLLPNGDRLFPVTLRPRPVAELKLPAKPFAEYLNYHMNCKVYRLEDLPPECADGYVFHRQVAGSNELREERAQVRLPGEVRVVDMPESLMWFPWLSTQFLVAPDGSLLAASFTLRRIADGRFQEKCPVVILRSTDNGRSFDFWGEILYHPDPAADPKAAERFGFSEHWIHFMPDGSALCLLRTDDGHGQGPLYQSRSTDNGKTWSKPVVFDNLGVWPQMLTLKNGVTLAAYGRPGLYLRASTDPAGQQWSQRVELVPPGQYMGDTCSYSAFLPLSDDTALIAYSDFNVPGPDGTPRKAIRVRRVKTVSLPVLGGSAQAQEPVVWPADWALPGLVISDRTTEPLLKAEKPWEDFCLNHLRVLQIGTTWHMWYNSFDHNYRNDGDSFLCYATSEDGVHWTRPNLNLFNHGGSTNNNILAAGIGAPCVFLDRSAPPEERFKIVYIRSQNGKWQSHGGISPDGIRWKLTGLIQADNADTDNVCFRDGDIYRYYLRMWSGGVFQGKRQVGYTESNKVHFANGIGRFKVTLGPPKGDSPKSGSAQSESVSGQQ